MREVAPVPEVAVPAGIEIRPARPGDARGFLETYRAVVAERRWIRTEHVPHGVRHYRRAFRRSWTDERATIMAVAVGDDRVVGNLGISREEHPVSRHVATLGMMVGADWRGRGVGAALMAAAFRWAAEVGVEKVALSVFPHNEAAIALYRKFGLVEEGRLVGHSRKSYGYEDEIVMARWVR